MPRLEPAASPRGSAEPCRHWVSSCTGFRTWLDRANAVSVCSLTDRVWPAWRASVAGWHAGPPGALLAVILLEAGGEELGQVGALDAGQLVELGAAGEAVGQDGRPPLPAVGRCVPGRAQASRTAGSRAVSATATETS